MPLCRLSVLVSQVMCREFSRCYEDVSICLWTDGSQLTRYEAQAACQQRDSFLPRITNSDLQYMLQLFRSESADNNGTSNLLGTAGFWIGVTVNATGLSSFQWIDGSSLASLCASLYLRISAKFKISLVTSRDIEKWYCFQRVCVWLSINQNVFWRYRLAVRTTMAVSILGEFVSPYLRRRGRTQRF